MSSSLSTLERQGLSAFISHVMAVKTYIQSNTDPASTREGTKPKTYTAIFDYKLKWCGRLITFKSISCLSFLASLVPANSVQGGIPRKLKNQDVDFQAGRVPVRSWGTVPWPTRAVGHLDELTRNGTESWSRRAEVRVESFIAVRDLVEVGVTCFHKGRGGGSY